MKLLVKVKIFNRLKKQEWESHVEGWDGTGGMPFLPMYIFLKENGEPRKKGYVVSDCNGHKFYHTKKEVFDKEGLYIDNRGIRVNIEK
jgi:hypothetical protein